MAIKTRHVKAIIQFRRGTEDEWIVKNPLLKEGEPALSIDINKIKIGDGLHHWIDIPYLTNAEATSYLDLYDLPSINGTTLEDDKTGSELGLQDHMNSLDEAEIDRIIFGGV